MKDQNLHAPYIPVDGAGRVPRARAWRGWLARGMRRAPSAGFQGVVRCYLAPVQNDRQMYRLRAPASGREAIAAVTGDGVYVDRETGEEMEVVSMVLPLAPSASALIRTPENLRVCRRCDQLIGLDVSDCPYCGLRQPALDGEG